MGSPVSRTDPSLREQIQRNLCNEEELATFRSHKTLVLNTDDIAVLVAPDPGRGKGFYLREDQYCVSPVLEGARSTRRFYIKPDPDIVLPLADYVEENYGSQARPMAGGLRSLVPPSSGDGLAWLLIGLLTAAGYLLARGLGWTQGFENFLSETVRGISRPPAAKPAPAPKVWQAEAFRLRDGEREVVVGENHSDRWLLGRGSSGENFIPVISDPTDPVYARISRRHAEIVRLEDGGYALQDLGSRNGTVIRRREGPSVQEIRVVSGSLMKLQDADVIIFSEAEYEFHTRPEGPSLERRRDLPARPDQLVGEVEPLRLEPERPLVDRLRDFARGRVIASRPEVELFVRDSKEKYVGRIARVSRDRTNPIVTLLSGKKKVSFSLDRILTVRGRGDSDDLSSRYNQVSEPQFKDKAINVSGRDGSGMMVMVDYADPRLTQFLEEYMNPIRHLLERGAIPERLAADMVWRVVHDYVPYDRPRGVYGVKKIPNQLYRLGDFIETGVCNERGMLVQVSNQYVGLDSRLEKGPFGGGRHAWVRSFVQDDGGRQVEVIHDPQTDKPLIVGIDPEARLYQDDATPFAHDGLRTIVVDLSDMASQEAPQEESGFSRKDLKTALQENFRSWEGLPPALKKAQIDHLARLWNGGTPAMRWAYRNGAEVDIGRLVRDFHRMVVEGRGTLAERAPTELEKREDVERLQREMKNFRGIRF